MKEVLSAICIVNAPNGFTIASIELGLVKDASSIFLMVVSSISTLTLLWFAIKKNLNEKKPKVQTRRRPRSRNLRRRRTGDNHK
jgi:hypothetical protein